MISEAANTLRDEQVKRHFMAVLDSSLPADKKYEEFIAFFERYNLLLGEIAAQSSRTPLDSAPNAVQEVSRAAEKAGLWNPQEVLSKVEACLVRALNRLRVSQHHDGGWGYQVEQSSTWGTAHAKMALTKARPVLTLNFPLDPLIEQARQWLKQNASDWLPTAVPPGVTKSIYETSLAVRCLCEAGDTSYYAVSEALAWIAGNQNNDGGWDAHIRNPGDSWPRGVFSEVGATRMAIHALVESDNPTYQGQISRAVNWLFLVRNPDGSWNADSCHPGIQKPIGAPSIAKTCDALQAIVWATRSGATLPAYDEVVRHGVTWVMARERLLRNDESGQMGWGYDDRDANPEMPDLDSTCLAMETLVAISDVSMPAVTANAFWLMEAQHSEPGSVEDGKWNNGDTPRITAALIEYYTKIKSSPLFATAGQG